MRQLILATALGFALSSLLVGCGGGGSPATSNSGSSSTPTGTCSTCVNVSGISGAPVASGQVTIKGSGTGEAPITYTLDGNGMKSIDLKGLNLTAPYLIQVTGTVNGALAQYVTVATDNDKGKTVSVSPLTNLAVARAANQDANAWFSNPVNSSNVANNLPTAAQQVAAIVLPILQKIDPTKTDVTQVDLLHFDPTQAGFHKNLDGLLDVITVTAQPANNQVTITYKADNTNTVTVSDDLNAPSQLTAPPANQDPTALTNALMDIQSQAAKLQSMIATSIPPAATLAPLFDVANFTDHGQDFPTFVSQIPASAVGSKISTISIAKVIDATHLRVRFTFIDTKGNMNDVEDWQVNNVNGTWLFAGNQQKNVNISIHSEEVTDGTNFASGIRFNVDPSNDTFGQSIDHAVITGPGLPSSGITLVKGGMNWLTYANSGSQDNLLLMDNCLSMPTYTCGINTSLGAVTDNSVYNVQLFDASNNLLNPGGYDVLLKKAPLTATAAKSLKASFATFSAPTVSPTSVTVSWNLPSGMSTDSDNLYISGMTAQGTGTGNSYYHDSLATTATSTTDDITGLNLASVPNYINESVELKDATGLHFRTNTVWP